MDAPDLRSGLLGAAALVLALGLGGAAQAARVVAISGHVMIEREARTLPAVVGSRLREGDQVQSDDNAEMLVRFDDGARMVLRAGSQFEVKELRLKGPAAARQKTLRILKGGLRYLSGWSTAKNKVAFETNTATIGIRGTDIEIVIAADPVNASDPAGTYLKVNTGVATIAAVDGTEVAVDPGEVALGSEPELVPRGLSARKRPAARKAEGDVSGLFKSGLLDKLLK